MAKEKQIEKLEAELDRYKEMFKVSQERNAILMEQAEKSFLGSATYNQMKEKISYLESLVTLNESHIRELESSKRKTDSMVQQIFKDNHKFCEEAGGAEYFVGITENSHAAYEYRNLETTIDDLKGTVDGYKTALADRDQEIERLHGVVGEMQKDNKSRGKKRDDIER